MAVRTSNVTTGNWSSTGSWSGGVVPIDGDSFVIASGATIYMDADQSAFATGMIAGTVNGTLAGPNGAGTGYLKMDGVAAHDITISSNGSLIHGTSLASPTASNSIFKINLGAASEIKVMGDDRTVRLYPTVKTIKKVLLTADAASSSTAITVDKTNAQLQADGWAVGDYISVGKVTTTSSPNQQLFTISSWGGGSVINLSGSLSSTYLIGAWVINHTSNIMILTSRTSGSECCFDCSYYSPKFEFDGNAVNTTCVSSYTNAGGYMIGQLAKYNTNARYVRGTGHGYAAGINYSRGTDLNGPYFTGCTNAVSRSVKANLDIHIFSCYGATSGLTSDCYITPNSEVYGCVYSVGGMGNMQFGGKVKGCLEGFIAYTGTILASADIGGTSALDKNQNGSIDFGDGGNIVMQGASLADTTKVLQYKLNIVGSNVKSAVAMYNYGGNYGQHWFYTGGGYTQPTTDAGFTALGYSSIEKMIFEFNANLNFIDLPVDLVSGQPFYMVLDVQLGGGAYTWVTNPSIQIVNQDLPFEDPTAVFTTAKTSTGGDIDTSSTSIQHLYISYVPTPTATFPYGSHRPAILRIKGKAGNSSGTGTDYMYFAYSQAQSVVADVQSVKGVAVADDSRFLTENEITKIDDASVFSFIR